MSLCGHHFVIVPFETAQKLGPQFSEKERDHACMSVFTHTHIQGVTGGRDKTSGECSLC
jgi:hypothetical protein